MLTRKIYLIKDLLFLRVELLEITVIGPKLGASIEASHRLKSFIVLVEMLSAYNSEMVTVSANGIDGFGVSGIGLKGNEEYYTNLRFPILPRRQVLVLNQGPMEYPQSGDVFGSNHCLTVSRWRHRTGPERCWWNRSCSFLRKTKVENKNGWKKFNQVNKDK